MIHQTIKFLTEANEPWINQYLYYIVGAIAVVGIIMLMVNSIFSSKRNSKRALANLIASSSLLLIFVVALIVDSNTQLIYNKSVYLIFIVVTLLYGIVLTSIFFSRSKSQLYYKTNKSLVYTLKDKEVKLYIVIKHEDDLYLNYKTKSGDVIEVGKNQYQDDLFKKFIETNKLNVINLEPEKIGTITINGKKEKEYRCFILEVQTPPLGERLKINKYQIIPSDLSDFDKTICMRLVLGDEFDITLDE